MALLAGIRIFVEIRNRNSSAFNKLGFIACGIISVAIVASVQIAVMAFAWKYAFLNTEIWKPEFETRVLAKNPTIHDLSRFAAEHQDIPNLAIPYLPNFPTENLVIPDIDDLTTNEDVANYWAKKIGYSGPEFGPRISG